MESCRLNLREIPWQRRHAEVKEVPSVCSEFPFAGRVQAQVGEALAGSVEGRSGFESGCVFALCAMMTWEPGGGRMRERA